MSGQESFKKKELTQYPIFSHFNVKLEKQPTGTTEKSGSQKIPVYRSSSLVCHAMRVKSGEDLKFALECYINRHDLRGAFIMSCVGSIQEASLRMADSTTVSKRSKRAFPLNMFFNMSAFCHYKKSVRSFTVYKSVSMIYEPVILTSCI